VEFRILGALEVISGDGPIALGGRREQVVLAMLLVEAGRIVSVEKLIDAAWEQDPPATAAKQIRNAVGRLRQVLASADLHDPIATIAGGYRLNAEAIELDARAFDSEVTQAKAAAGSGDLATAVRLLDQALARWRGPALAGLGAQSLEAAAAGWNERRLAAQLARVDHRLANGEHSQVVAELTVLVAEHPLRERPVELLMTALHRGGRRAEALAAYSALRARLAEELGLDPGPDLKRLHQQVLAAGPAAVVARAAVVAEAPTVPSQLPAPVRYFVGRAEQLKTLDGLLDEQGRSGTAVIISAIDGTAGIGKTALAVYWAHRVAPRFPDGQLYVNLRGFDPSGAPMAVQDAVRGFLSAFQVEPERLPMGDDAQLTMYHTLLADRRVLVVLDNAYDAEHVRPLLPRTPGGFAVVTSRRMLAGLAVADGAHLMTLGLLASQEAREVLSRRLSASRTGAEPVATDEIVESCARLPLALSIAAAHAAARAELRLAQVAAQLRDTRSRLDALGTGDPATEVRAVFSWSYHHLDPATARMFRLLGIASGPDISPAAAASLAAVRAPEARRALIALAQASLLSERAPGRYAFHDLLRAYAAEQAEVEDDGATRRAANHRILDYYLYSAYAADRLLHPARDPLDLTPPLPGVTPEDFGGLDEARAWLELEHANLLDGVRTAAEGGFASHAWQLAWSLATYFQRRGHWADWTTTQRMALRAAEAAGDWLGQLNAHRALGRASARFGGLEAGEAHLTSALNLADLLGDRLAQARTLVDLAWVFEVSEGYQEALDASSRALELFRELQHALGQAESLNTVGWYLALSGDYHRALAHCQQALGMLQELGHRYGEAGTWDSLGYIHHLVGSPAEALDCYRRAVALFRALGDRAYEAGSLERIGDASAASDPGQAREAWAEALRILDEVGHPDADRVRAKLAGLPGGEDVPVAGPASP
jgi:DNA-binding SARP family transcriptional activator